MGECEARTQGAPICRHMGATEDAASRRPARPGDTSVILKRALSTRDSHDILDETPPAADERVAYGGEPLQFADLRHADGDVFALVVHGGVWKAEWDLTHTGFLCEALRGAGISTANVEYRRVGNGGGWPVSLDDVVLAVERFAPHVLVGHSAGGHLALLAAKRTGTPVVAIAAVSDPHTWANPGVRAFFGDEIPDDGSPLRQLPLGVPTVLVHGTLDDTVPFSQSQRFADAADARLLALEGAGHFEPVDPQVGEWTAVRDAVALLAAA